MILKTIWRRLLNFLSRWGARLKFRVSLLNGGLQNVIDCIKFTYTLRILKSIDLNGVEHKSIPRFWVKLEAHLFQKKKIFTGSSSEKWLEGFKSNWSQYCPKKTQFSLEALEWKYASLHSSQIRVNWLQHSASSKHIKRGEVNRARSARACSIFSFINLGGTGAIWRRGNLLYTSRIFERIHSNFTRLEWIKIHSKAESEFWLEFHLDRSSEFSLEALKWFFTRASSQN